MEGHPSAFTFSLPATGPESQVSHRTIAHRDQQLACPRAAIGTSWSTAPSLYREPDVWNIPLDSLGPLSCLCSLPVSCSSLAGHERLKSP